MSPEWLLAAPRFVWGAGSSAACVSDQVCCGIERQSAASRSDVGYRGGSVHRAHSPST
jgi:hypothetical protein